MRKFHSPVNLKAAADAALHTVAVDVTLAELVQAHALARPSLELELRLRKWCDPVLGFGHESAWAISSERLINAAQALIDAGYAFSCQRSPHWSHFRIGALEPIHDRLMEPFGDRLMEPPRDRVMEPA